MHKEGSDFFVDLELAQDDSNCLIETGAIKLQSSKMGQNYSILLAILQVMPLWKSEAAYIASARSDTDEWLKGLDGR